MLAADNDIQTETIWNAQIMENILGDSWTVSFIQLQFFF